MRLIVRLNRSSSDSLVGISTSVDLYSWWSQLISKMRSDESNIILIYTTLPKVTMIKLSGSLLRSLNWLRWYHRLDSVIRKTNTRYWLALIGAKWLSETLLVIITIIIAILQLVDFRWFCFAHKSSVQLNGPLDSSKRNEFYSLIQTIYCVSNADIVVNKTGNDDQ